jgi:hypothetical protein
VAEGEPADPTRASPEAPSSLGLAADIRDEAAQLGAALLDAGISARLMGGVAIWLRCPTAREGRAREYGDIDLASTTKAAPRVKALLEARGYVPDKFFNGLHGATRLYYGTQDGRWSVDVVIDSLDMSHRLDLRTRLDQPAPTLPLADLLLTKLQVWEINRKDLSDALCVLADHELSEDDRDPDAIGLPRIRSVLGADWGFSHTVEGNLRKVLDLWHEGPPPPGEREVGARIEALRSAIDAAPKTFAWRTRARIGERMRWYETPEEVGH